MINIKGLPDLQRKLNNLDQKVQKTIVKDALRQTNIEIVLPAVEALVPVDTGALKAGLKVKAKNGRGTIGSAVFDEGYKGDQFYGSFQELGTKHQKAKPYLRPAIDQNQAKIFASIAEKIKHGIEEATR
jgi:HK97 gp10 family phage protein